MANGLEQPLAPEAQPRRGAFTRFLDTVEWLGNLLPHPVSLFALICVVVLVVSGIAGEFEVQVTDPRPEGKRAPDGVIRAVSLLNPDDGTIYSQTTPGTATLDDGAIFEPNCMSCTFCTWIMPPMQRRQRGPFFKESPMRSRTARKRWHRRAPI